MKGGSCLTSKRVLEVQKGRIASPQVAAQHVTAAGHQSRGLADQGGKWSSGLIFVKCEDTGCVPGDHLGRCVLTCTLSDVFSVVVCSSGPLCDCWASSSTTTSSARGRTIATCRTARARSPWEAKGALVAWAAFQRILARSLVFAWARRRPKLHHHRLTCQWASRR